MPSCYNSDMTKSLAKELADNIGCLYTVIPVQDSLELTRKQFSETILHQGQADKGHLALTSFIEENIQARDRSSRILSAAAAAFGGVFTCNANKAETSVGYATLYGDSAGYLAATADLWKHQVYELAHYLNDKVFGREVVPQGSIDIVPSAELSNKQDVTKGQGDPLIYPYHDYLFAAFVERWQRLRRNRSSTGTSTAPWKRTSAAPSTSISCSRRPRNSSTTSNAGGASWPALPSPSGSRARPSCPSAAAPSATTCAKPS